MSWNTGDIAKKITITVSSRCPEEPTAHIHITIAPSLLHNIRQPDLFNVPVIYLFIHSKVIPQDLYGVYATAEDTKTRIIVIANNVQPLV